MCIPPGDAPIPPQVPMPLLAQHGSSALSSKYGAGRCARGSGLTHSRHVCTRSVWLCGWRQLAGPLGNSVFHREGRARHTLPLLAVTSRAVLNIFVPGCWHFSWVPKSRPSPGELLVPGDA